MVPRADLPAAVALNSVGFNLTRSVGPAIGGLIVATAGAAAAFAVNSAELPRADRRALRAGGRTIPPAPLPRERLGPAMGAGLRYVAMSPNILKVLLRSLPLRPDRRRGAGAAAAGRAPPRAGRPARLRHPARRLRRRRGRRRLHRRRGCAQRCRARRSSRLAFAGFAVCAAVVGAQPDGLADRPSACCSGGACWVLALSLFNTTVQLSTPRWVVGRALVALPDGGLRRHGARQLALGQRRRGATARRRRCSAPRRRCSPPARVGLRLPLPARAELDLDPLEPLDRAAGRLDLKPRSGPIAITHRVPDRRADDVPSSSRVMAERQRIRRRDGARALDADARPRESRGSGSRATRPRPGSNTSATTSAGPRPTPRSATASARCTAAPTCRASTAASCARPAGSRTSRTPASRSTIPEAAPAGG